MYILNKIKETKKWKLFLLALLVYMTFNWSSYFLSFLFSNDTDVLIKDFGNPTSYTIVFGEMIVDEEYKTARYEALSYERHGRSFSFIDGEFSNDQDISFIDEADPFPISPDKFKEGMTFEQVKKVIGADPSTVVSVPELLMENAKVYDFNEQIKVAVEGDEVIYIQTFPIKVQ
ncbi:MAG: hypothetical protein KAR00_01325 [Candidatus Pacebacteria bacterium]|nr:hypothetical protein [Candidatus Paceibacterota bacterium]